MVKCFEINVALYDNVTKTSKLVREYFHQDKGPAQAITDTLAWINLKIKIWKKNNPNYVIDGIMLWSWSIAIPQADGEIKTKRSSDKVLNWSFDKDDVHFQQGLKDKQKKRFASLLKQLNKYRHSKSEVKIEEITGGSLKDNAKFFSISSIPISFDLVEV
jgi:hypothetical protein